MIHKPVRSFCRRPSRVLLDSRASSRCLTFCSSSSTISLDAENGNEWLSGDNMVHVVSLRFGDNYPMVPNSVVYHFQLCFSNDKNIIEKVVNESVKMILCVGTRFLILQIFSNFNRCYPKLWNNKLSNISTNHHHHHPPTHPRQL